MTGLAARRDPVIVMPVTHTRARTNREESVMKRIHVGIVAMAAMAFGLGYAVAQNAPKPPSNDWLLDAPNDTERFKLLQRYLRGFDQPMWEVGYRYEGIHDALKRDNYALAIYHWDKIKTTIENGYMKRPARRANADAILFSGPWDKVKASFESRDRTQAWAGFALARTTCIACHEAEKLPEMNGQAIFHDLVIPAK
jgi:mono/diheme cytochrome c family protein